MGWLSAVSACWVVLALAGGAGSATILAVFPYPGYSHFAAFAPFLDALVSRGHRLTVLSFFPKASPPPGYTDLSLARLFPDYNNNVSLSPFEARTQDIFKNLAQLHHFLGYYEPVMASEEVQSVLGQKYDLVLVEAFNTDMFLGVAHRVGAPVVALSSCAPLPWHYARFGSPALPSAFPGVFSPVLEPATFWERLANALEVALCRLAYRFLFEPYSQDLAERHLGPLPPLSEVAANTSLFLVNTHFSLHRPRPLVPAIIEVGGLHVTPPGRLPQRLEKIMNEAKEGVILFSMGSLLRGSSLPAKKRQAFLEAFARLNQTVLWKWEDQLQDVPPNVHIDKWFPQSDILGHPNMVLFITHGGLLGLSEAAYNGVPCLGIPMFGDQEHNVGAVVSANTGLRLRFQDVTQDTLLSTVRTILTDPTYKKNAVELSKRYKDRPLSAMDTAIFWTEYVIRHKGAPFMHSSAAQLSWYQEIMLDIIIFLLFIISSLIGLVFFACFVLVYMSREAFTKTKKLKSN